MGDLRSRKCKECEPAATIARIREILSGMRLAPIESEWFQQEGGFYSLRLTLPGTMIGTNGKGTSPEYALASAYGELMERLSNMAPFRLAVDMPDRAHRQGCFLYAPDEIPMSMGEVLASGDPWIRGLLDTLPEGTDRVRYLRLWRQVSYEDRTSDFYGIRFISLIDGQTHALPMKMLSKLYMSNGMCAGNSLTEALIQGLCECYERYANRAVVLDGWPLYEIGRERIEMWPLIKDLVQRLEADGRYAVTLYDASLGLGLPVAAVLLTDRSVGGYFVKFGGAQCPELAIERTLTELMQGQQMGQIKGMQAIHADPRIPDRGQNMMGILTNGIGIYPFSCFSGSESGDPLPDYGASSNEETLSNLISLAQWLGYDVLARDVSFLGFPAAHVVVPGMSEVSNFGDVAEITQYAQYNEIKRRVRALGCLSEGDARELLAMLAPLPEQISVLDLLQLQITGSVPWYYQSVRFLKISLALRYADFSVAADLLDAQFRDTGPADAGSSLYYRCARDICLLHGQGKSDGGIKRDLGRFYPAQMLTAALAEMKPGSALYERLGTLPCFECGVCPWRKGCAMPGTETLYGLLKRAMMSLDTSAPEPDCFAVAGDAQPVR